jgi:hypothetical protein
MSVLEAVPADGSIAACSPNGILAHSVFHGSSRKAYIIEGEPGTGVEGRELRRNAWSNCEERLIMPGFTNRNCFTNQKLLAQMPDS